MALTDSFPTEDAGGLSIADTRLILAGLIVRNQDGTPRLGVIPAHTGTLVTGTAGMAYEVSAFHAATSRNGVGVELVANDGVVSVATTAAPASNSRIDVIWVRALFDVYGDAGLYAPVFGVTQGTAGLTPAKPAIPAGALELATATVTSTDVATSTTVITQTHQYTAAAGGTVILRGISNWSTAARGQRVFSIADNRTWTRVVTGAVPGGDWIPDHAVFLARRVNTQSLGVGWNGIIGAFGSAEFNDIGTWSPGALQVLHGGIYRIGANVRLGSASNPMAMQMTRNSTLPDTSVLLDVYSNSSTQALSGSAVVALSAGDVLRVLVYTSVSNTIDTVNARGVQISAELLALT